MPHLVTAPHSSSPSPRPDVTTPDGPSDEAKDTGTRLSFTQVTASGLAAISATVLMSFFGVAGTIIGAGLASVATVIGNFLYTRSIEKAHAQLKPVVANIKPVVRPRTDLTSASSNRTAHAGLATTSRYAEPWDTDTTGEEPTVEITPAEGDTSAEGDTTEDSAAEGVDDAPPPRNRWLRLIDRYGKGKVLTVTALAVFLVVMGVVLVVELAIGKPISDAVRGQEGSGTSISTSRDRGTGSDSDDSQGGTSDTEQRDSGGDGSGGNGSGDHGRDQQQAPNQDAPADDPTSVPDTDPTAPATDGSEDGSTDTGTDGSDDTGGTDEQAPSTGDTDTGGTDTGSGTDTGRPGTSSDGGTSTGTGSGATGRDDGTSTGESGTGATGRSAEVPPVS